MDGRIKRGGARQNAGRKSIDGAHAVKRYSITLDAATIDKGKRIADRIANGSLSAAIRILIMEQPEADANAVSMIFGYV